MITCPKCGCEESTKDGIVKGASAISVNLVDTDTQYSIAAAAKALCSNGKHLSFILKAWFSLYRPISQMQSCCCLQLDKSVWRSCR